MALNKIITLSTAFNGADLIVTDNSEYDTTNPKSIYTNRHLVFTFADATEVIKEFPYSNTDNSLIDSITYVDFFSKDSVVDLITTFEGSPSEVETATYLSIVNSLKFRSTVANSIELFECDACSSKLSLLTEIDSNIESAKYAAEIVQNEKSQKFLDRIGELHLSYLNACE